MARTACSEATELNSQRRDIHHPRSNRRIAEMMMRQTRPQHQRGRNTRCPLMPKIKGDKQGASISCRTAHPTTRRNAGDN